MERTWKPTAAGILCIIAGVPIVVIPGIVVAINVGGLIRPSPMDGYGAFIFILFFGPLSILLIIAGTVAIVGGICALRRKNWGLALAGSICALPAGFLLGILAIIFVIMGKREFK
ncbi:MAG: PMP-22/EMP/MP20 family protein [Dehalococcoidia bacterium]|nr:PMP-22/EMP/MP20 family protein [Dehalococcoidia bacterium]